MTSDDIALRKLMELLETIADRVARIERHVTSPITEQHKRVPAPYSGNTAIGCCTQCGNWIYPNTKDHYGWFHTTKCNACNPYPWNPTEPPTAVTPLEGPMTVKEQTLTKLLWLLLKDRPGAIRMNPAGLPINWQLRMEEDPDYPGRIWVSAELNKTPPEPLPDPQRCEVPPEGWSCSRERGHEGPCAARPIVPPAPPDPRECL